MIKAKTFTWVFLGAATLFLLFHLLVWEFITRDIFEVEDGYNIGDLARLSYLGEFKVKKKQMETLAKKHGEYPNVDQATIVTIGDSFSNGDAGGLNPYYQDFLATRTGLSVVNVKSKTGFIPTVLALLESGELKRLQTKVVIIESVERNALKHLSSEIPWETGFGLNDLPSANDPIRPAIPKVSVINKLNFNAVLYRLYYHFSDNAFFSKVYKKGLKQKMFSCSEGKTLLFFAGDLRGIAKYSIEKLRKMNNNLNRLSDLLAKADIKLVFMPAVDKYDLYLPWIVGEPPAQSPFFSDLRSLKKSYQFVDTKKILRKKLQNGEQDVFYCDDTHWSPVASEAVSRRIDI